MADGPVPGSENLFSRGMDDPDAPNERGVEDAYQDQQHRRIARDNRFRRHQLLWDVWWYGLASLLAIPFVLVGGLVLAALYYGVPFVASFVPGVSFGDNTIDLLAWRISTVATFATLATTVAIFARSRRRQ